MWTSDLILLVRGDHPQAPFVGVRRGGTWVNLCLMDVHMWLEDALRYIFFFIFFYFLFFLEHIVHTWLDDALRYAQVSKRDLFIWQKRPIYTRIPEVCEC